MESEHAPTTRVRVLQRDELESGLIREQAGSQEIGRSPKLARPRPAGTIAFEECDHRAAQTSTHPRHCVHANPIVGPHVQRYGVASLAGFAVGRSFAYVAGQDLDGVDGWRADVRGDRAHTDQARG
jgi:hypothetical protein